MAITTICDKDILLNGIHYRNMTLYIIDGKYYRRGRKYYERLWAQYPDVIDLLQFREMLGGIGDSFARKLMHKDRVKHFFIKPFFWIPKVWLIDFVLSEDYAQCQLGKKV